MNLFTWGCNIAVQCWLSSGVFETEECTVTLRLVWAAILWLPHSLISSRATADFQRITVAIETEITDLCLFIPFSSATSQEMCRACARLPLTLSLISQAHRHYPITWPTSAALRMRRIWKMKMRLKKRKHPAWRPHHASLHLRKANHLARSMDSVIKAMQIQIV